jgi:hypothetical protein
MRIPSLAKIKKEKLKKLETEVLKDVIFREEGELFLCPFCKYESKKNRRGTAKMFTNKDGSKSFKCFSCGRWRVL